MASARVPTALLGCGLFAHDVYARLLVECKGRLALKAAWSRTEASAAAFVTKHAPEAQPLYGEEGLSKVLADPEIQLCIVVLPVQTALTTVRAALAAGKHVIEEKPLSGTVKEALHAINEYRRVPPEGLWLFAENYRYEAVFLEAASIISKGILGDIIKLDLVADMPMNTNNKYYSTEWRRDTAGCPGGQIMESSVHFTAALRLLARAAGLGEATQAVAFSRQVKADLSPPDTLVGCVTFPAASSTASADVTGSRNGQGQPEAAGAAPAPVAATVSISLAAGQVRWSLSVVGTKGSLEVLRGGWGGSRSTYALNLQVGSEPATSKQLGFSGTSREMGSFLHLISNWVGGPGDQAAPSEATSPIGSPSDPLLEGTTGTMQSLLARASPEEGARDLAMVEALLQSASQGGVPVPIQQVPGPALYS